VLPSKKFISMPIISLKEGQQIGFIRNLVIDPRSKSVAAFVVDPKGFFKEQRIIPFNRVTSIGENAITVSTESQVEKATNLPDILELLKEKAAVIGIKVITEAGKTLGFIEEFYIDPEDGVITHLDISEGKIEGIFNGKARLAADDILTIGSDVVVVAKDCEERLDFFNKGINENFKSILQVASTKATMKGQIINDYWKNRGTKDLEEKNIDEEPDIPVQSGLDMDLVADPDHSDTDEPCCSEVSPNQQAEEYRDKPMC